MPHNDIPAEPAAPPAAHGPAACPAGCAPAVRKRTSCLLAAFATRPAPHTSSSSAAPPWRTLLTNERPHAAWPPGMRPAGATIAAIVPISATRAARTGVACHVVSYRLRTAAGGALVARTPEAAACAWERIGLSSSARTSAPCAPTERQHSASLWSFTAGEPAFADASARRPAAAPILPLDTTALHRVAPPTRPATAHAAVLTGTMMPLASIVAAPADTTAASWKLSSSVAGWVQ